MAVLIMTQLNDQHHSEAVKAMFHDFLGTKRTTETLLSGSSEIGDVSRVEGLSCAEMDNKLEGNKQSNSDSWFIGSSKDMISPMGNDSFESIHLMKMLKNGGLGSQLGRLSEEQVVCGRLSNKLVSSSSSAHNLAGNKPDTNSGVSERDHSFSVGVGSMRKVSTAVASKSAAISLKDISTGSSLISHSVADEGSRTGFKGPGISSSFFPDKNLASESGGQRVAGGCFVNPESTPLRREGLTSISHQMTIFYGGQAHVFDEVHPNKADIIMALAGSNGGSWTTSYSPGARPASGSHVNGAESEPCGSTNPVFGYESTCGQTQPMFGSNMLQQLISFDHPRSSREQNMTQ